ncbi:protein lethal(2)essential for life [Caerostris extrusa]|uniref:Protein lethal(2)essential for life n=1 Tax=Caerostris extrusa TaxID=172846 RepID=A0AAV4XBL9_CAEEX|nr:protein lethal(2)essential for life [Caerostris extrusa]
MSNQFVIPSMLSNDWWKAWDYPERIMDQFFGMEIGDSDLLAPLKYRGYMIQPRTQASIAKSGESEVKNDDKKFQVSLNVKHFKPEELEVKVEDNYIVIHGKHEEKTAENDSFCSREFIRRYMLPKECDSETVTSSMISEGILTISAPKKNVEPPPEKVRKVPIEMSDESKTKPVENIETSG